MELKYLVRRKEFHKQIVSIEQIYDWKSIKERVANNTFKEHVKGINLGWNYWYLHGDLHLDYLFNIVGYI